ncbi:MAG: CBS domain-containing protein [Peptococcaceae bacterium]
MNIAFFLTPKKDVIYATPNTTMRQALERMEHHRYTAIPVIDNEGHYIGTITEGDLLWKLKNTLDMNLKAANKISLKDVPRHMHNQPVTINCDIENLILISKNQNFVPVTDDQGIFIGIITRSAILDYCYEKFFQKVHRSIV